MKAVSTEPPMNLKTIASILALLGQAALPCKARAVCLDPKTWISGYKDPLRPEVRSAEAIVIGRVVAIKGLQDDPSDPDGYTADEVKIKVISRLKGNLPKVFVFRNENTSSRYAVSIGEEHLLFLSRTGKELWVNSCGNSSAMPEGKALLKRVRNQLQSSK